IISRLYIENAGDEIINFEITVADNKNYKVKSDQIELNGIVGNLIQKGNFAISISSIDAAPGTKFKVSYIPRLRAITDIQKNLSITDQGKDTG
ncbi:tyrosine-protein kinase, partial [Escherichia coli]